MLLKNKNAVIYGAGGAIGSTVANAFAREGARVFLTGRNLASVAATAKDIVAAGGAAEAEFASHGIRAICLRSTGLPESRAFDGVLGLHAKTMGIPREQFLAFMENMTHTKRSSTLAEVADVAVFLASDKANGMTGTVANLTGGIIVD